MTQPVTVQVDRLVIHVTDYRRLPGDDARSEVLEVDLEVENPMGSPDQFRNVPPVDLRDQTHASYEVEYGDALARPLAPDEVRRGSVRFAIPSDATSLSLVFAPGVEDEEVAVDLT